MNREAIERVVQELDALLAQAAGAYVFATSGLLRIQEFFAAVPRMPENPDPTVYLGIGDPNLSDDKYARFNASDLPRLLAIDGPVAVQLGQQWAVFVFAEWEEDLRPRLANAWNRPMNEIRVDVFGDLRRMRNDILHNRGVASDNWSGKCAVLRWFKPGDRIVITAKHIAEFIKVVPWDVLRSGSFA